MLLAMEAPVTPTNLGGALRARRRRVGLSRSDVANLAGITYEAVRLIETGQRTPGDRTLKALSDALGCTVDDLLVEVAS